MLRWALAFAIIALIAGALGFYGLSATAADIAKFFALIFLVLFVETKIKKQKRRKKNNTLINLER